MDSQVGSQIGSRVGSRVGGRVGNRNGDAYPIGEPGTPWGAAERAQWLAQASIKRSYTDEVVSKVEALKVRIRLQVGL
jgi:hypothetical protein